METSKIIDFKILEAAHLEDQQEQTNADQIARQQLSGTSTVPPPAQYITIEGLNTKISRLIAEGYEPYGELKIDYSPVSVIPGTYATMGGQKTYIRELVKYQLPIGLG